MIHIHFIVNPIAGRGKNSFTEEMLLPYFDTDTYRITIKNSEFKGNAILLTQESIMENAQIIVACGGDGTINEIASTLVGTNILLGIIPIGSGNGLASNLKIPKNIHKSLNIIKKRRFLKVDVGCVNARYFFSNTGFGFTANVIENYEVLNKRTLLCYIKATLKSFLNFSSREETVISINGKIEVKNPFMIFVSNSNVMGYKMSLTPKASLEDGLLDVLIVPKMSKYKMLVFCFYMLAEKLEFLKEVHSFQTEKISLSRVKGLSFSAQIDGELSKILEEKLLITVKANALNVIA